MSITSIVNALEILKEIEKEKEKVFKLPISKLEIKSAPLIGEDDELIKRAYKTSSDYIEVLASIASKRIKVKNENGEFVKLDKNELAKKIALDELNTLIYALLVSTYEEAKNVKFICENCALENTIEKIKYEEFKLTSKIWDKEKPFTEYIKKVNLDIASKYTLNFYLKYPSLYEGIQVNKIIERSVKSLDEYIELPLPLYLLNFVDKIEIIINESGNGNDNNNNKNVMSYDNKIDIKTILEKLDYRILNYVKDEYLNEFKDYIPRYSTKVICSKCGKENEIYLNPEIALINKIFGNE